jgi:predicted MFS family arabinose efflux permease
MLLLTIILGLPYMQLLPVFQEVLKVGPELLGFMYASMGFGGLIGSLLVASFLQLARGFPQFAFGVAFGISVVAFAVSPSYPLSLVLLFVTGFTHQGYTTINQTLIVTRTDPALYGRVMGINTMTRSFVAMSILPMGALIDAFGAPTTLATSAGVLALAFVGIALFRGTTIPEAIQHVERV